MKISIITINYNNLDGLKRTVKSVLEQTRYDLIEYIIIDGGSIDGSYEYLQTLPSYVKWISEKDRGISDAFNKGLKFVTGDAILYLNSGDTFLYNKIIESVAIDLENNNVDILSYKVRVSDSIYIPSTNNEKEIYDSCTEPHQGTFVSKKIYDTIGIYSEEYKIRMDFHFFSRCKKRGATFKFINKEIVKYEEGGTSMKSENRIRFWKEGLSIKLMNGLSVGWKDVIKFLLYRNTQI